MYIGDRIRQIRKEKDITLVELAKITGIQIATLSRIEHKKMVGTLESHMSIAKGLGIDVTDLYRELENSPTKDPHLTDPVEIFTHNDSTSVELLTKDVLRKKMMPTIIHLNGNAKSQNEQYKIGTERFIYALDNEITININKKDYLLKKGTSIYFDASLPHQFVNNSNNKIRLLCVTTPATL